MDSKLINIWYKKYLSFASSATLIDSTLQTLPYYRMASFQLPKNILKEAEHTIKIETTVPPWLVHSSGSMLHGWIGRILISLISSSVDMHACKKLHISKPCLLFGIYG